MLASVLCCMMMTQFLEQWWGKPAIYMSQVTVTCLSAQPLPAQRTDCSAKDWTPSNKLWASCSGTLRSHSSYTTQGRMQPPHPPYTHTHKYTHIFLAIKINMSFHFGQSQTSCRQRWIITEERTCKAISPALKTSSALNNNNKKKQSAVI